MFEKETEATSEAEPEAPEAEESFRWRRDQYLRHVLGLGGGVGDRRNLLFSAGRQIDWSRMR